MNVRKQTVWLRASLSQMRNLSTPTDQAAENPTYQRVVEPPPRTEPIQPVEPDRIDWSKSFHGLSAQAFSEEAQKILLAPLDLDDIECKPDGMLYLPEIKYRRILNKAFGPGGWGLAPRGETSISPRNISREYGLICLGRLVSVARGEQDYFDNSGIATAAEGAKSNALMRCCKDLGIGSELWDPTFIREFKAGYCEEVIAEHVVQKKRKKIVKRKDRSTDYPYKLTFSGPDNGFSDTA